MMKVDTPPRLTPAMREAVLDLQRLVKQHYPEASFQVVRSPDNDHSIDIWQR
jgi:hypothetical protein